jgi:peptidoglycan/LPS O-acetylase OafA/YrhL
VETHVAPRMPTGYRWLTRRSGDWRYSFHANLRFTGGSIGVDVFFVISGFLITSLILEELSRGAFSLGNFWERRVRRIIPASALLVGCTLAAGVVILPPSELVELAKSPNGAIASLRECFFLAQFRLFRGSSGTKAAFAYVVARS